MQRAIMNEDQRLKEDNSMAVITISRQTGSLGEEIGKLVSDRLGYRLVYREVINQAAIRAGAPSVALSIIDDLGIFGLAPTIKEIQAYHQAVQQVIEELAEQGNIVIIGRAGQVILRNHKNTIHVLVIGNADMRAQRLAQSQHITLKAAAAQVTTSDRSRQSYLKRYYNIRWLDPQLYDLVISTDNITPAFAAEMICSAATRGLQAKNDI